MPLRLLVATDTFSFFALGPTEAFAVIALCILASRLSSVSLTPILWLLFMMIEVLWVIFLLWLRQIEYRSSGFLGRLLSTSDIDIFHLIKIFGFRRATTLGSTIPCWRFTALVISGRSLSRTRIRFIVLFWRNLIQETVIGIDWPRKRLY